MYILVCLLLSWFAGLSNHDKLQDQSNIMMNYIGLGMQEADVCMYVLYCLLNTPEKRRRRDSSTTGPGSRARRDRAKQGLLTSLSLSLLFLFPSPPSYPPASFNHDSHTWPKILEGRGHRASQALSCPVLSCLVQSSPVQSMYIHTILTGGRLTSGKARINPLCRVTHFCILSM